jgi:5-methyltetrahydrofolate--homocysteine methyltransferase
VGANKNAAVDALETIKYCREQGFASICGLSNVSFGLPERGLVNATFLTMAVKAGLTMAIANPNAAGVLESALTADLLLNREGADMRYIDYISQRAPILSSANASPATPTNALAPPPENALTSPADPIKHAVIKGQRRKITDLVAEALAAGQKAKAILDDSLLPAIDEVGRLFDKGVYFLPQLIAGAETMKLALEQLEPLLKEGGQGAPLATVVIATVAGDVHDIGKNLVALMLRNHGFRVIDLGKDVKSDEIIRQAVANKADIIALSALMTTTMTEMKTVIKLAKESGLTAAIIVGGAVVTAEYAQEIGADGYSADAAEAVRLTQRLVSARI